MVEQEGVQTLEVGVSQMIVEEVAQKEGVHPVEVDPPLYEIVDPDALDQLFADSTPFGRMEGQVVFNYNDYQVSVHGDGHISVDAQEDEKR